MRYKSEELYSKLQSLLFISKGYHVVLFDVHSSADKLPVLRLGFRLRSRIFMHGQVVNEYGYISIDFVYRDFSDKGSVCLETLVRGYYRATISQKYLPLRVEETPRFGRSALYPEADSDRAISEVAAYINGFIGDNPADFED